MKFLQVRSQLIIFGIFLLAYGIPIACSAEENQYIRIPNLWLSDGEDPPKQQPYRLPRFDDTHTGEDHYTPIAPIKPAKYVNAEQLFITVTACYPEPSKFRLEVELEAAFRDRSSFDSSGSDIGKHYVGIVARMPLYSTKEFNRERQRELLIRQQTAEAIGSFMKALAKRNHAQRELGLYSSLEARAQIRVQSGFTGTDEQVKYLQKVADAQKDLIEAEGALIRYRLHLVAMCDERKAEQVNQHIARLAEP